MRGTFCSPLHGCAETFSSFLRSSGFSFPNERKTFLLEEANNGNCFSLFAPFFTTSNIDMKVTHIVHKHLTSELCVGRRRRSDAERNLKTFCQRTFVARCGFLCVVLCVLRAHSARQTSRLTTLLSQSHKLLPKEQLA